MATRKRAKSSKGMLAGIVWFLALGSLIMMFYNIPRDPSVSDLPDIVKSKSDTVESWMQNCVPGAITGDFSRCSLGANVGGTGTETPPGTGGGAVEEGSTGGTGVPVSDVQAKLNAIPVQPAEKVKYNRDEWNHWISQGRSCWDTRDQVLYEEAVKDSTLVLLDKSKKVTTDVNAACSIQSGTWHDNYSGETFTNPSALDVDHMIPLSYAAQHGGQAWDANKKQQYANDLSNPNHLIAAKASENRSKSDKGPSEYKPSNTAYYCAYATDWVTISTNYGLSITDKDKEALTSMLATCK